MPVFDAVLPSSLESVKAALGEALDYVRSVAPDISREDYGDIKLVVWELLLNAAIHGNELDASKSVKLAVTFDGADLTVVVEDEGSGFDYRTLLASFGTPDFESEHGRGVRLAVALMDQFSFNGAGNRVCCAKSLSDEESRRRRLSIERNGAFINPKKNGAAVKSAERAAAGRDTARSVYGGADSGGAGGAV